MKAQYTIGEIAKIYGISTDTLRLYEKMGLIIPTRGDNHYRYYSIFDIWKLNIIKTMKSLGVQLKDIKRFLNKRSAQDELELLIKEDEYLNKEINRLKYRKENIENRITLLDEAIKFDKDIELNYKEIPERIVSFIHGEISMEEKIDFAYSKLSSLLKDEIYFLNRDFGMILDLSMAKEGIYNRYKSAFLVVDNAEYNELEKIPNGKYLQVRYRGPYSNAKKAYSLLFKEIEEKELKTENYAIERYIIDVNSTDDESEYLTEIQVKIL